MPGTDATGAIMSGGPRALPGKPRSRTARLFRERCIVFSLFLCGLFSVGTTVSIIYMLASESVHFFGLDEVGFFDFLFGLEWAPLLGSDHKFGVLPLVWGTTLVAVIAACVSIPLGLVSAVYMSEYAPRKVRAFIKPTLEILAGIPTVVYGVFALTVITPALQWVEKILFNPPAHESIGTFNALSAGIAVGIMTLPTVSSLSEDALGAVPRALRQGAYALGSTKFDVSVKVVVPAALSGVIASFLLAIARAVGETMIVVLAAGGTAAFHGPLDSVQTLTAYMVQIVLGDAPHGTVEYYSIFAVGGVLFVMTMIVTLIGNQIRNRFREEYS
ncbi:MAG: phosphate ABC transporter permease subunit PstC [Phycisphaerales bacterium JB043]